MRVIEHSFSDLLRRPKHVTDDVDQGDVLLRRRDEPDLRLSRADREVHRAEAFSALGRALRHLAIRDPEAMTEALADAFPWIEFLPSSERSLFADEFSRCMTAATAVDNYELLSQLLTEWRATAEVHADAALAGRLGRPLDVDGDHVTPPST